jgi:hypothetical protein
MALVSSRWGYPAYLDVISKVVPKIWARTNSAMMFAGDSRSDCELRERKVIVSARVENEWKKKEEEEEEEEEVCGAVDFGGPCCPLRQVLGR